LTAERYGVGALNTPVALIADGVARDYEFDITALRDMLSFGSTLDEVGITVSPVGGGGDVDVKLYRFGDVAAWLDVSTASAGSLALTEDTSQVFVQVRVGDVAAGTWTEYSNPVHLLSMGEKKGWEIPLQHIFRPDTDQDMSNYLFEIKSVMDGSADDDWYLDIYDTGIDWVGPVIGTSQSAFLEGNILAKVSINGAAPTTGRLQPLDSDYRTYLFENVGGLFRAGLMSDNVIRFTFETDGDVDGVVYPHRSEILLNGVDAGDSVMDRIFVAGKMTRDSSGGAYTGTANGLIEKPTDVAKHFLIAACGSDSADVGSTSFDSDRTTRKMAFQLLDPTDALGLLDDIIRHNGTFVWSNENQIIESLSPSAMAVTNIATGQTLKSSGWGERPYNALKKYFLMQWAYSAAKGRWQGATAYTDGDIYDEYAVRDELKLFLRTNDSATVAAILDDAKTLHLIRRDRGVLSVSAHHLALTPGDVGAVAFKSLGDMAVLDQEFKLNGPLSSLKLTLEA
jgi:hypothetical protein